MQRPPRCYQKEVPPLGRQDEGWLVCLQLELHNPTSQPLCVGEGIMDAQAQPGLHSPSGIAVCVYFSVYSCITRMLCHFSAVRGLCVSSSQQLAAGVLLSREARAGPCNHCYGKNSPSLSLLIKAYFFI